MKKAEKTELTKKKILHQAMQEFGSKGYRGASLNAICEAGIPKGLLYHNFKNKDALYLACNDTTPEECLSKTHDRLIIAYENEEREDYKYLISLKSFLV